MARKKASEILEDVSEREIVEQNEIKANSTRLNKEELISTGSTLLDIALTNTTYGGLLTGKFYHFVGGSTSGKTMTLLHVIANIVMNPKYDDYDIIMDEPEDGNEIDMETMFGPVTASRIKAPRYDEDGDPIHSVTVEDFYDELEKRHENCRKKGKKFFYFLDSMDALTSEADLKKIDENMKLREKDKEAGGSYGMGKASVNSKRLGIARNKCKKLDCTLFVISQERDDISFGSPMGAKCYSGGKALKFYADAQIWFRHFAEVAETVLGDKRCVANDALINITKNRLSGQKIKKIPLRISFVEGIDDVSTLIDYMVKEKVWGCSAKKISDTAKIDTKDMFGDEKNVRKLTLRNWIIENDKEEDLIGFVKQRNDDIQDAIRNRITIKKKYK